MAKPETHKIESKKHMARQEREAIQTRYIKIAAIAILVVVLLLVGYAIVEAFIITPNKPVAVVNNDEISTKDYQARVKFERLQLVNQFANTLQLMQSFDDENALQYFQSNLQQINFQLTPEIHGQSVLDTMIDDVLISQAADRQGITVSDTEIDEYIASAFGYFPDGTPTPVPTTEPVPTSTHSPQQLTLVPESPTTGLTSTEDIAVNPDQDLTEENLPTPTVYTENAFKQDYQDAMKNYKQSINVSEEEFRVIIHAEILRGKMSDQIGENIPREEEQIWARHILVETEQEAQDVLTRLEAGEDFATLAMELSTDTGSGANGGDLGWFGRGRMVPEFEQVAFNLAIGEISDPVQTSFGFHIIQKLGQEMRLIDDQTFEQLKQTAFNEWLTSQRITADIQKDDTWSEVYPETPIIPPEYQTILGQ